jgi:hypothetical protein
MRIGDALVENVDNGGSRAANCRLRNFLCQKQRREQVQPEMRFQRIDIHAVPVILPEHGSVIDQQINRSTEMCGHFADQLPCIFRVSKVARERMPFTVLLGYYLEQVRIGCLVDMADKCKGIARLRQCFGNFRAQAALAARDQCSVPL